MAELGTAYILIEPSMEGSRAKISKEMTGAGEKAGTESSNSFGKAFGKGLKSAVKVGATAIAAGATATVSLVTSATKSYAEYEQLIGGTELLFGSASDSIVEKSKSAYKDVQMSQNDYLQQVNGFAVGLKTSLKGNEQAAADLASKIVQAEADVVAATGNSQESVQNAFNGIMKGNYTMLDNLQLGITPTKKGMQDLITQVNKWNKANGKATKYNINNLADCQAALVDYIEMQGLSGYAAKESAGTIEGSLASTKASWEDLLTAMARGDAVVSGAMDNFIESVSNTADNIIPVAKTALRGVVRLVSNLGPQLAQELPGIITDVLPGIVDAGISIIGALIDAITSNLDTLLSTAGTIISTLISTLMSVISSTDWVQLGKDIVQFIMNIDWAGLFTQAAGLLGGIAGALFGILQGIFEEALANITPWLQEHFGDAADLTWEGFLNGLASALADIGTWLMTNVVDPLVKGFCDALGLDGDAAVEAMHEWITNTMDVLIRQVQSATEWGRTLVMNVKTGISNAWTSVKTWVTKTFNSITEIVKKPFDKVKEIVEGAIEFIKGLFNFSWSLPKLKLPHFSVTDGSSVLGITLPKISIDWYAKATNTPYLFSSPTVVGGAGGLRGFGERGDEIVYGRENLLRDIASVTSTRPIDLDVSIIVNGAEGQNVNELADIIMEKMQNAVNRREAVFA